MEHVLARWSRWSRDGRTRFLQSMVQICQRGWPETKVVIRDGDCRCPPSRCLFDAQAPPSLNIGCPQILNYYGWW